MRSQEITSGLNVSAKMYKIQRFNVMTAEHPTNQPPVGATSLGVVLTAV